MRISFVSDIHGNIDGLAQVAAEAEQLVVLGDLLDYVDYHDPGAGILGGVFGADRVREFSDLRARGEFVALHRLNVELWNTLDDPIGALDEVVHHRYTQAMAALQQAQRPPLLILGNVDVLASWNDVSAGRIPALDAAVVEVAGLRLGFVAGGASRHAGPVLTDHQNRVGAERAWRPFVRPAAEYRAAVAELTATGGIDILCSHLPPKLSELRYDRVPARLEMFGPGLLEAIDAAEPRLSVFGHVHQPLAQRVQRGRTSCVNVGHFARFPQPFVVEV